MEANWRPLERRLPPARCAGFMFMGRVNGIYLYKHRVTRRYLNLSEDGRAFLRVDGGQFEETRFAEALALVEGPPEWI